MFLISTILFIINLGFIISVVMLLKQNKPYKNSFLGMGISGVASAVFNILIVSGFVNFFVLVMSIVVLAITINHFRKAE